MLPYGVKNRETSIFEKNAFVCQHVKATKLFQKILSKFMQDIAQKRQKTVQLQYDTLNYSIQ